MRGSALLSAVCLRPGCPPSPPPERIPRCLAGQPCQQHLSGGGVQPEPRSPSASCLEGTWHSRGGRGRRKVCCTGPGHRRAPLPGMTVWERKGLSALARLGPGPLGSHEAHAPGIGTADILITRLWLIRQVAATPSWAVCRKESKRSVTPQTGVQAEAFRAAFSSRRETARPPGWARGGAGAGAVRCSGMELETKPQRHGPDLGVL